MTLEESRIAWYSLADSDELIHCDVCCELATCRLEQRGPAATLQWYLCFMCLCYLYHDVIFPDEDADYDH